MNRRLFILLLILTIPAVSAAAHPHMFIDMKLTPVFSEDKFIGVRINWLFDMVFTGSVLMDNGIGWKESFSESEIQVIRDTSFINLINYNYFTYFNCGGRISRPSSFSDFTAYMSGNRLGYGFFLPYSGPASSADEIRIAVYDDTFFCDIAYTESSPVRIEAPGSRNISWTLSKKEDAPIFYDNTAQAVAREGAVYTGQAFPVELVLITK